jgi:cytochrome c55X
MSLVAAAPMATAQSAAPTLAPATPTIPAAADAPAELGRKVYLQACQRCHGINLASSGIGLDLRTFPQAEKERFMRSVAQGLRAMPAWKETLKPEQMEQLWAYVGAVNGWK